MPLSTEAHAHAYAAAASRSERAIVRAINRQRDQFGLPRVRVDRRLGRAADQQTITVLARDLLGHGDMAPRLRASGVPYATVGETLAFAPRGTSARRIVSMWMASPAHRAQLLSRTFRRVGVGRRFGKLGAVHGVVVTADFGSRR